ncbi:hypothetical protein [Peptostreptococcus faecalis]
MSEGDYKPYAPDSTWLYAFTRNLKNQKMLVLNNFRSEENILEIEENWFDGEIVIQNYPDLKVRDNKIQMRPFESVAFLI